MKRLALLFAAVALLTSGSAWAVCNNSRAESDAFDTGRRMGTNIARVAWQRVGEDCNRLEEYNAALLQINVPLPLRANSVVACQQIGMQRGINNSIQFVGDRCLDECATRGILAGESFGQAFCQIGIAAHRSSGLFCPSVSAIACKIEMRNYVNSHCPNRLAPGNADLYASLEEGCNAYGAAPESSEPEALQ